MKKYIILSVCIALFSCHKTDKKQANTASTAKTIQTETELSPNDQFIKAKEELQVAFGELENAKSAIYNNEEEKKKAIADAERKYKLSKEYLTNLEKKLGKKAEDIKQVKNPTIITVNGEKLSPESQAHINKLKQMVEDNKKKREEIKKIAPKPNQTNSEMMLQKDAPREQ